MVAQVINTVGGPPIYVVATTNERDALTNVAVGAVCFVRNGDIYLKTAASWDDAGALHTADTAGAHLATAITADSATLVGTGTTVQAVFEELDDAIVAAETVSTNHLADTTDAHSEITTLNTYKPLYATLTSDSASMTEDTTVNTLLTVTLPIAGTYDLECFAPYTTSADADLKVQFAGNATVTATVGVSDIYYMMGPLQGGDATTHQAIPALLGTSWTTAYEILTTGAPSLFPTLFKGRIVASVAGTITFAAAQVTSIVTATLVGKGAYLKLQRVA